MAFDGLLFLRSRTLPLHNKLEQLGVFARITHPQVNILDYQKLLCIMQQFYCSAKLELPLFKINQKYKNLYRNRLAALNADLKTLNCAPPSTQQSYFQSKLLFKSDYYLLGILYATEGSTLGGQIIERHCKKVLGAQIEGAHNYLSHLTTLSQGHWREILQLLQRNLLDQNTAEQAISGANSAFSLLEILATKK